MKQLLLGLVGGIIAYALLSVTPVPFGADFDQATAPGSSPTFNKINFNKATSSESVTIGNLLEVLGTGISTLAGTLVSSGTGTSTFAGAVFGAGSSTPYTEVGFAGDVAIGGALGTSTLSIETTSSSRGGCIELRDANGRWIRMYAGAVGTTTGSFGVLQAGGSGLIVESGARCQTGNE